MKKILVTGAGGFVGARILEMWRGRFELSAFPPDFLRTADETAVRRFITAEHPDVIVHTAALSNTQVCQQHPEESFRANVLLPEWVAAAKAPPAPAEKRRYPVRGAHTSRRGAREDSSYDRS